MSRKKWVGRLSGADEEGVVIVKMNSILYVRRSCWPRTKMDHNTEDRFFNDIREMNNWIFKIAKDLKTFTKEQIWMASKYTYKHAQEHQSPGKYKLKPQINTQSHLLKWLKFLKTCFKVWPYHVLGNMWRKWNFPSADPLVGMYPRWTKRNAHTTPAHMCVRWPYW